MLSMVTPASRRRRSGSLFKARPKSMMVFDTRSGMSKHDGSYEEDGFGAGGDGNIDSLKNNSNINNSGNHQVDVPVVPFDFRRRSSSLRFSKRSSISSISTNTSNISGGIINTPSSPSATDGPVPAAITPLASDRASSNNSSLTSFSTSSLFDPTIAAATTTSFASHSSSIPSVKRGFQESPAKVTQVAPVVRENSNSSSNSSNIFGRVKSSFDNRRRKLQGSQSFKNLASLSSNNTSNSNGGNDNNDVTATAATVPKSASSFSIRGMTRSASTMFTFAKSSSSSSSSSSASASASASASPPALNPAIVTPPAPTRIARTTTGLSLISTKSISSPITPSRPPSLITTTPSASASSSGSTTAAAAAAAAQTWSPATPISPFHYPFSSASAATATGPLVAPEYLPPMTIDEYEAMSDMATPITPTRRRPIVTRARKSISNTASVGGMSPLPSPRPQTIIKFFRQSRMFSMTGTNKICDVFGMNLIEATIVTRLKIDNHADENYWVPAVVSICIEFLNQYGIEEEGIYRISGSVSGIEELKKEFAFYGADMTLKPNVHDVHVVASFVKSYIRSLPEEIIYFDQELQTIVNHQWDDVPYDLIRQKLSCLPIYNFFLLRKLCKHLSLVASSSHRNRMPLSNLIVILCPTMKIDSKLLSWLIEHPDTCMSASMINEDKIKAALLVEDVTRIE
ncbi:hypothetical protein V1514DRAFT_352804 [Lipomyces japonicus]|uniref:uncharacterized protein n=1 Tax=Lipomyces japonicus TaxID=56871 RepID=UPI0034CEFDEF